MSDTATLSLKVMVNKEKKKVLFAEADGDFANVVLSFLTLPLGRIVKLLEKHFADNPPVLGSLTSLYKGLENLEDIRFSTPAAKLMLLHPPSSSDSLLYKFKPHVFNDFPPRRYFSCSSPHCEHGVVCIYYGGVVKCNCGLLLKKPSGALCSEDTSIGVFTLKTASFIISDDLKMVPNSGGFFQTLRNFGDKAELSNLTLGTIEIMDLLKCCLFSKTPLSDFLFDVGEFVPTKPEAGITSHQIEKAEPTKEIILKVMVQKSTNRVLFAEAEDDFIELLSSFLIIPLAGVESLFDANTGLNNLDNLYRSLSDVSVDKYFVSPQTKERLMNPYIPHASKSKNAFLPLKYEDSDLKIKSPKGEGNHIKWPTTYLVTDDLTVAPYYVSSTLSILNDLNVSLSQVVEREVNIGLQEGLSILKASLTSNSALTSGLMNRIMRKQPKHEH